jgi:ABC-type nitrate/sulfonate/bicarbonate transport system ATPase subunit
MAMAATDQEIDVTSVDLTLGNQSILKGIDLSIRRREFVCVVGPSGCGKTSLLRLLAGLYQPTRGAVSYRGTAMTKPRQDIAVVFQDYGKALLPWRTAHGNIALALEAMTRQGLQDEILSIVESSGASAFFVTHDIEEAIYLGDRVIGLLPHPGRVGIAIDVGLPRPRDQLATRELPHFLHLRRELFDFIKRAEA